MIAFLIGELNIRGGTHKQFLKLIEYCDSRNVEFKIITKKLDMELTYPDFKKFKEKIFVVSENERAVSFLKKISNYNNYVNRLREITQDAEIINIHDNGFELYLKAFNGKRVYWQVNDLPYSFVKMHNSDSLRLVDRIKLFFIRRKVLNGIRYVKGFSVNVSKNKERIQEQFNRTSEVFYCGIDPIKIERSNLDTMSRFSEKKINLLSSGVFFPYRNYETQIRIIKELSVRGYDVTLNIIGSTELSPDYVNKIRNLIVAENLQDRINICGQVSEETFELLHKNSDVFLFINVNQSWGLAVFESMSCGLPVIVSDSVGATEILTNNYNALFVDPFDVNQSVTKIIDLVDNVDLYDNIAANSKKIIEEYTWDKAYSSKMLDFILDKR